MQEAVPVGQGAMAGADGARPRETKAVCEKASQPGEPVEAANLNGGGQIVISGHTNAVDRAIPEAKAAGAKIAKKLAVSAPFPLLADEAGRRSARGRAREHHDRVAPRFPSSRT